ncbi:MAG: dihydrofolate reductase family protein [Rhodospirillales bacterium]|nr:dihydrofolate reductase family protein [Alphaproteobacteria bacterium]MCB9986933.1 dihydrofolate reductase family protein [Rhodospirillales bacterium]USO08292.1 MAG: dihydrofolate reductase family protein [Rhodospirillales bacterium]
MKATLYIASSLNGFITKGETDSNWVSSEDEKMFTQVCGQVGCVLVGSKTFQQYQDTVYPVPGVQNVVLTTRALPQVDPSVHGASDMDTALNKIRALGFDRFVVVGGASVIDQCFQRKLIDRVYLSLHPCLFSDGLPLALVDARLSFEGIKAQSDAFVLLDYKVIAYD